MILKIYKPTYRFFIFFAISHFENIGLIIVILINKLLSIRIVLLYK
jgi:hypothetical protein